MKTPDRYRPFTLRRLDELGILNRIPSELLFEFRVVSTVLPFRVSQHVVDELIDWRRVPDDPVYRSLFPHRDMLPDWAFERVAAVLPNDDPMKLKRVVSEVRQSLNPHPGGQTADNAVFLDGEPGPGLQHKYAETVLFFAPQAQTCHAYCAYCFRWAQFTDHETRMRGRGIDRFHQYLARHPGVSDLLMTGGDPMVMKADKLARYLLPLRGASFAHIQNIRLGTKALTFWPQRFVTDADADDLLRLLEALVEAGKHVALMAHITHWQEMRPALFERAIKRIQSTGAVIRSQAPLLAHVNDKPDVWARMWERQVHLGMIPYYMFVERDTGARRYFELPLERAWHIYKDAVSQVSGLARTARGPVMSCHPGKIEIQGTAQIAGRKVFVLRFIQARDPALVQRPFFADYDPTATWYDRLRPAFADWPWQRSDSQAA